MPSSLFSLTVFSFCSAALTAPTVPREAAVIAARAGLTPYQPTTTSCPKTQLVRPASGQGSQEADYISSRKTKADVALAAWLSKQGSFSNDSQPTVGLTSSGGGYRALLEAAGVHQAFDARDSNSSVSGLYQALTYESGLSGGAWFLSSLTGNNWPTISYLRDNLWEDAFEVSLLLPANLLSASGLTEYAAITAELTSKEGAGYNVTVVDPYGRLLSYQLLEGISGGVNTYLSGLTSLSNFTDHNVPYPVITALGSLLKEGQCPPPLNATQYEFSPYEFGSWDQGVSAFASSEYLGSDLTNGQPKDADKCLIQYDNLGYVLGTSSNVFAGVCEVVQPSKSSDADLVNVLEGLVDLVKEPAIEDLFARYPNPFYNYSRSSLVEQDKELFLADGGLADQNNPIWPFIQPARDIDVLIVSDNSADTSDNFPNGTEIRQTYLNAQAAGLSKMPFIPDVSVFVDEGLNKRATFFGCNETDTTFIVWLPLVNYTYPANQPTARLQYSKNATDGMINNANLIASQNGDEGWPLCLACAIKSKDEGLPEGCDACFDKYCYRGNGTST